MLPHQDASSIGAQLHLIIYAIDHKHNNNINKTDTSNDILDLVLAMEQSEACRTISPVIKTGYSPKGRYEKFDDINVYVTGNESSSKGIVDVRRSCMVPARHRREEGCGPEVSGPLNTLPALFRILVEAKQRWPSVQGWGIFGLCWGGKIAALASGPETPFKVSGQAHPGLLAAEDAEKMTIPHICLASHDEPANPKMMRRGITPQLKQISAFCISESCLFEYCLCPTPLLSLQFHFSQTMSDRKNLGPLTNSFTPPSSCTINVIARDTGTAWQGQECTDDNVFDAVTCWPTATVPAPVPPFEGWGFYSPGLVCPDGYTSACTASFNPSQSASFQFALSSSETAVGCCPTGFTCLTGQSSVQTCSLSATSVTLSGGICHGSALQDNILIIPTTAATINSSPASIAGGITYLAIQETAIYAPLIQLVWQASDLTETTSTSSTSSTSTTISPSIPGPTQSPALPGGLSTGVKAAIGISVSVGVIAAIALAAFILIRRRRGATTSSAPPVFSSSRAA
ncbi:MAG: hypothetical protein FRX48_03555 [Lasallia pustulata]|uniref:Dienelactone hydrolase domain-containing protein n=1 Tax=Lasallia pustulata TaxID=136370 RepID=A0A5M8PT01_9LECA|nr:MAG: hypothetical protein FRX48_03555 [Lasallia pustulata]